jgi:hypothetical protein
MSYKLMPRLGSAIASTILSVFSAVSLVGVDKAQAALLTYSIDNSDVSFFKVDTSSLTGIGREEVPVSEGRFYGYTLRGGKEFYDLVGISRALFFQGEFRGLSSGGGNDRVITFYPGPLKLNRSTSWHISSYPTGPSMWESRLDGYFEEIMNDTLILTRSIYTAIPVSFTLVNTEAEPVPEPLTSGGTALALAGLSWLKHKKKMAA